MDAWEGIAEDVLDAAGVSAPVNVWDLAAACGLHIVASDTRAALLYGDTIYVSRRAPWTLANKYIAHELGHWCLDRAREPQCEDGASAVGAALLVPRRALMYQLRRGWNLDELRAVHRFAPASMIAERIATLREGTAAVYDDGRLLRRTGPSFGRERQLVAEAMETRAPVRIDDLTGAWPVVGAVRRVVVLASAI